MLNNFTRIDVLKQAFPKHNLFYTQTWIYSAIVAWYSQQNKFDELCFTDTINSFTVCDYNPHISNLGNRFNKYGLVFEGHIDYWAKLSNAQNCFFITGHEHLKTHKNDVVSLGFDYWDLIIFQSYNVPALWNEINRQTIQQCMYDVVIATGSLRPHRLKFLTMLEQQKQTLKIVTDAHQTILKTPLRFDTLGMEVYFNKVGVNQYKLHTTYPSFFDTNSNRSLDHMPHKLIHQLSRVNVALETTTYNTQQPYLTEKTYKILANHRPFVILGDTNALRKLKQQGFKTFEQFCDESYDQEIDFDLRCQKVITAIHQLVDACIHQPDEIDQICAHNQAVFFDQQRHTNNLAKFGKLCLDTLTT